MTDTQRTAARLLKGSAVTIALFRLVADSFKFAFGSPTFTHGERVNRMFRGALDRTDGRVLTQSSRGVLVEWPRHGQHWEEPTQLCAQVA